MTNDSGGGRLNHQQGVSILSICERGEEMAKAEKTIRAGAASKLSGLSRFVLIWLDKEDIVKAGRKDNPDNPDSEEQDKMYDERDILKLKVWKVLRKKENITLFMDIIVNAIEKDDGLRKKVDALIPKKK